MAVRVASRRYNDDADGLDGQGVHIDTCMFSRTGTSAAAN